VTPDSIPLPPVSVIMPARDDHGAIGAALDSVIAQEYDSAVEIIVADASETTATETLIRRNYPQVQLVRNPERLTPAGLNRALAVARHPVVARCDARSVLPPGYLSRAVGTLLQTGAVNVGGRQNAVGTTYFGRSAALAMSCWLGTGGAVHRVGGPAGPADTVYLGVFRRDALEAAGGFASGLARSQDSELNWRLCEEGGTVWFDPELVVTYRPRPSLPALARQYFASGRWKRAVIRRHPRSLRARQALPPLMVVVLVAAVLVAAGAAPFVAGCCGGAGLRDGALTVFGAALVPPLLYMLVLVAGAVVLGLTRRAPEAVLLPVVLATMHLAWGAGFLIGVRGDGYSVAT